MTVTALKQRLPEYAKDLRLNLDSVLTSAGAPGLKAKQIWGTALAAAITARHRPFTAQVDALARAEVDEATLNGAKAATAIMAMNNIYYCFLSLVEDPEYRTLPARLRMNVIGRPGIDKVDFELYSLAVSAINGCGSCLTAYGRVLRQHGLGREAIQSAVRITAMIYAVVVTLEVERDTTAG